MLKLCMSLAFFAVSSVAVSAAERAALLIGNSGYTAQPAVPSGWLALSLRDRLTQLDFEQVTLSQMQQQGIAPAVRAFDEHLQDATRALIFVTGHIVTTGGTSWILATDAPVPDVASLPGNALSVSLLLDLAARTPGGAIVALGVPNRAAQTRPGVRNGLGAVSVPQGVTLITGGARDVAAFLSNAVLVAGASMKDAVENKPPAVTVTGFVPADGAFVPAASDTGSAPSDGSVFWQVVVQINSQAAYEAYLTRFPNGAFAPDARQRISAIKRAPLLKAQETEAALGLNRQARQRVQRHLSLLGYNTRGIDGIWGPGTRAAISAWQRDNALPSTGYLNRDQIGALAEAAAIRAAELEEEARKKEEQRRLKDIAFWNRTGQSGTEKGLRRYLKRYPDGIYSGVARRDLDRILDEKRGHLQQAERQAWDAALKADTIDAYGEYLKIYPEGQFSEAARARIDELRQAQANADAQAAAARDEQRLGLPAVTFLLVEQRLAKLGFEPGRVDGKLDEQARKAIRRFQRAAGLPVTGYLNNLTVVRLVTG